VADRGLVGRPNRGHEAHDLLLVAAHAAGDLDGTDLVRAESLAAACDECANLATDLRAIARATGELPEARAPRDFFVSPADARRLRPQGLRRLVSVITAPRVAPARPLAGGLMMLGVAGLLVASLPGLGSSAALAPADRHLEFSATPSTGSDIQALPGAAPDASGEPSPTDPVVIERLGGGSPAPSRPPTAAGQGTAQTPEPDTTTGAGDSAGSGPSALVVGSLALLAVGAALFVLSLLRTAPRRI